MPFLHQDIKEIAKKWFTPFILFISLTPVLILDVRSVVFAKTHKASFPKVIFSKITPSPSPLPTFTPTPTLTLTPTSTATLTPTPNQGSTKHSSSPSSNQQTSGSTASPTQTPQSSLTTSEISQYLLDEVNKYRASQGVAAAQMDSNTCDFAQKRAQELKSNFSHDGFNSLPYASYSQVTENIAQTGNYKDVIPMWVNSSGHAANMRANTPFICVKQYEDYYALEGWRP